MASIKTEGDAVRQELERVLESPGFSHNERMSRFLRFVVEGHLDGKDHELKESVIAVEVFGRRPDFDSRLDPAVRTEAVRLHARLSEYYIKDGKTERFHGDRIQPFSCSRFRRKGHRKHFVTRARIHRARAL